MYYSELVKKAGNIMFEAHKEDVDKGGYPYVFHPYYVASKMEDEETTCVALLHDVVEDHGDVYTFEYIERQGFSKEILTALRLLTHDKKVPYMDYIKAIAENPIARKVKLADLAHNTDIRRTGGVKTKKYDIYLQAIEYLNKAEGNK